MPYLGVLLVAAAAGVGVAALTLRAGRTAAPNPEAWTRTHTEPASTPEPGEGGSTKVAAPRRPLPSDPTWQSRLTGIVGLVVACLLGAMLVVGACLLAWAALQRAFGG